MLLVRHGETRANLERRYHGRRNSPLTDRGRAQAHAMGRQIGRLPEAKSAKIVSSPQPRAHRTAEIIREHLSDSAAAVSLDDRLCEVSIGNWEGCSHEEIAALAPGTFEGDGRYEWCFCAPRGETYDAFTVRIADWLRETPDDPALIVVTHGIVARVLRGLYAGLPRLTALSLPIPQDRIFRLSQGTIAEIVVEVGITIPRIVKVTPMPDYRLLVEFDDGVRGPLDIRAGQSPSIPQFHDEAAFQQVTIDDFGAVSWPSGPGLSSEAIYEWLTQSLTTN
jgi:probable phosphoglycerate mutase